MLGCKACTAKDSQILFLQKSIETLTDIVAQTRGTISNVHPLPTMIDMGIPAMGHEIEIVHPEEVKK